MSVAQSAIVSKWFKGKELAFALGLNLSVSRIGSVINGAIVPPALAKDGLGFALLVGLLVCCISVVMAILLVVMDKKADMVDGDAGKLISDEEKFRFKDILSFKLSFWIICGSCVITYMAIFPFLMVVTKMLQVKYGVPQSQASLLFGIPYIISACSSPFLGLLIDKIGKRVHLGEQLLPSYSSFSYYICVVAYCCSHYDYGFARL